MTDRLFNPNYAEPINPHTQVDRMPDTPDSACICDHHTCLWPFCDWKEHTDRDGDQA